MKSTGAGLIVLSLTSILVLCLSFSAYGESGLDYYHAFERWSFNFDPLGDALIPLNEIPHFKISGSLSNWTRINVHKDRQVGFVNKDWRFQQIQWIGEIEPRYQFTPRVELVGKIYFLYDAVYDWQSSSLYADEVNKDAYISHTGDQFLREFHLDIEADHWYLKFGKQQVPWGKMEGRWMDFINNLNAKDSFEIRASLYGKLRIPLWMANVTYTFQKSSLQFLWIPDFKPELRPIAGSPWWSPLRPDPRTDPLYRGAADEPGTAFDDHQWAVRFDTKLGLSTWSLGYMYGFSPASTNFIRRDPFGQLFYDPEYTRAHFLGSAIEFGSVIKDVPLVQRLPFNYRAEVVYKTDQFFTDYAKWDPINHILKSDKGVSETELVSGSMKLEFFFPGNLNCFYQPMVSYYSGWKESLGFNEWTVGHLFLINKIWHSFEDRLYTTLYTFIYTGGPLNGWQGVRDQIIITWKFSDNIEGKIVASDYRGGDNDLYGQFDKWDSVGWEMNYTF